MDNTKPVPRGDELSVIIPFYNEEANVAAVLAEVRACQPEAEIIAVDDGSNDDTWSSIAAAEGVAGVRFSSNRGQSAAMLAGLQRANRQFCVTMDGDGQNDPADIINLLAGLQQADAVFGIRVNRKDSWDRRFASKFANGFRRLFVNDGVVDTGCSLKLFRTDLARCLPPVNGVHRFMGAYFAAAGYRIAQVPVNHRPRGGGMSKYGNLERALRGIYDLIGVSWYIKRRVDTDID
jgi:dolichol-phosphate mannosyltransferase